MSKPTPGYKPGDRVSTTGDGRTATWPRLSGTVEATGPGAVYVRWDGTLYLSDEMDPNEVKPAPQPGAASKG